MTRIGLLGKKVGMTQIFNEQGHQVPVTVLEVGPCHVTDIRTKERDGYVAVQLGFGSVKMKNLNKATLTRFKKLGVPPLRFLREVRTEDVEGLSVGQQLAVDNFEAGDYIDVEGTSIGKGFQGVVKRHGFKGSASKSHGTMHGREPGSIGQSSYPSRVLKGMKAAGHMGHEKVTVQNLKVVKVDPQNNLLVVYGSVPGTEDGFLMVRTSLKRGTSRKWKLKSSGQEVSKPAREGAPEAAAEPEKKTEPVKEASKEKAPEKKAEKTPQPEAKAPEKKAEKAPEPKAKETEKKAEEKPKAEPPQKPSSPESPSKDSGKQNPDAKS